MEPVTQITSRKMMSYRRTCELEDMLENDYTQLKNIPEVEQTPELVEFALKENWRALEFVKNPTDEQIRFALLIDGSAIRFIKKSRQTEDLCIAAIRTGTRTKFNILKNIKVQTNAICLEAVKSNPSVYKDCKIQSDEIKRAAITRSYRILVDIEDQDEEICLWALSKSFSAPVYFNKVFTEDFYKKCIDLNNECLRSFTKEILSYDLALYAVRNDWRTLNYFSSDSEYLTEELCMAAYQQDIRALQFLWSEVSFPLRSSPQKIQVNGNGIQLATGKYIPRLKEQSEDLLKLQAYERERLIAFSLEEEKRKLGGLSPNNTSSKRMDVF